MMFNSCFTLTVILESDHINWTGYKKVKENFPNIKILGNNDVNENLKKRNLPPLDIVFSDNFQFQIGDTKITTIQNYHGEGEDYAETHGLIMETPKQNLLFATDLSTLIDYEEYCLTNKIKFDIILLEANYDPQVIEFYESTRLHTGFNIFANGSYRHLSTTDREVFVEKFKKPDAIDIELHLSETYRTFGGLIKKSKGKITQTDVDNWLKR